MDKFFTQKRCDKCGGNLEGGRIMSMFDEKCLCMLCSDKEKLDVDYEKAVKADHEQIKKGNFNFVGIRAEKEKR